LGALHWPEVHGRSSFHSAEKPQAPRLKPGLSRTRQHDACSAVFVGTQTIKLVARATIDQPAARPRETGSIILDWSHDARHRTDFSREPLRDFFGKIVSSETADFRACY